MDFLSLDGRTRGLPGMYWGSGRAQAARRVARTLRRHYSSVAAPIPYRALHRHATEETSLMLELDEHSAVAGMLTRLEAYRNGIGAVMAAAEPRA
jgi:hypothetical protein